MRGPRPMLLVIAALLLGACGAGGEDDEAAYEVVSQRAPGALARSDDPVVWLDHRSGAEAVGTDVEGLRALGTVRATVFEPWLERDVDFEGVWLADLLEASGVNAGDVLLHALDDYEVTFDVDDIAVGDALLAVSADGAPIAIEDGGPVRLVFLREGPGDNTDLWIWNIDGVTMP